MSNEAKVVIVTGGAQGIGKAIVLGLLEERYDVVVFDCLDVSHDAAREVAICGATYIHVDVGQLPSIEAGFARVATMCERDEKMLYALINNAGITRDNLAVRLDERAWDSVLDVNLKGSFFASQCALRSMVKQRVGYIVNISSIVGDRGNKGQVNYAASKAGIAAMTKTLALEYGKRNIIVNAIAPGFITTQMTRALPEKIKETMLDYVALGRFGEPRDVASLVSFLISGKATYITGQVITVDGGLW